MTTTEMTAAEASDAMRNGVDTAALFATLDAVKQAPEAARFQFRAHNQWVSGTHNRTTIADYFGVGEERTHERTFVFVDSRHVVPHVVPVRARDVHAVYVMHNLHVLKPYRWDSEVNVAYTRVLRRAAEMDALVTLTERQRDDIAERRGRTSNMFVVPNPVDLPAQPTEPPPRDPHRVTIMARLEPQKRLQDAIAAFARVVQAVPEARLDIFGEGSRREQLQQEIDRLQLGGSVTLRGFDPEAREALWTSSAFVLSSAFEGYPLSTLESMSRGCPLVSYDITRRINSRVDCHHIQPNGELP